MTSEPLRCRWFGHRYGPVYSGLYRTGGQISWVDGTTTVLEDRTEPLQHVACRRCGVVVFHDPTHTTTLMNGLGHCVFCGKPPGESREAQERD